MRFGWCRASEIEWVLELGGKTKQPWLFSIRCCVCCNATSCWDISYPIMRTDDVRYALVYTWSCFSFYFHSKRCSLITKMGACHSSVFIIHTTFRIYKWLMQIGRHSVELDIVKWLYKQFDACCSQVKTDSLASIPYLFQVKYDLLNVEEK